jgi:hypothetical protein
VFCLVLEFKEEKRTFAKIECDNMDFFQKEKKKNKKWCVGLFFCARRRHAFARGIAAARVL